MDTALTTTIVSTSGAVITGVFGMFFTANQLGKRIDDISNQLGKRIDDLRVDVRELRSEFYAFKDVVKRTRSYFAGFATADTAAPACL
jgi:predicted mannosyl-3-phosphoglycerate phosphatase (HAD superfamily)